MITAAEARKQVADGNAECIKEAREYIHNKVSEEVKKGHISCYLYGTYELLKQAEKEAIKAGYKAEFTNCQRDGPMLKLGWSN